jgi:hypothetical protein
MSLNTVREILSRANSDKEFRDSLLTNPEKALLPYDLTQRERDKFKTLNSKNFVKFQNSLDRRFSKDAAQSPGSGENDFWVDSVTD